MAQQLRAFTAVAEDLDSIPSTCVTRTIVCNTPLLIPAVTRHHLHHKSSSWESLPLSIAGVAEGTEARKTGYLEPALEAAGFVLCAELWPSD